MWSIPPIERADRDLDVPKPTKAEGARLDSHGKQQGGRRKRSRFKRAAEENSLEVDVFEHGDETEV